MAKREALNRRTGEAKDSRYRTLTRSLFKFYANHGDDADFWDTLWRDPFATQNVPYVPPELRKAVLLAKLNGALEVFPQFGCYVGEWSLEQQAPLTDAKEDGSQNWKLGVFALIPHRAHDFLFSWFGFVSETEPQHNRFIQSFPWNDKTYYINIADSKGREQGFSRKQAWIAAYVNEPPPGMSTNAITSRSVPKRNIYPNQGTVMLPSVDIYTSQELDANQEIFFLYYQGDVSYSIGHAQKETRRRLYFFLPSQALRNWVANPKHEELLAKFIQTRMYHLYIDDFSWRKSRAPSRFSNLGDY